MKIKLALLTIFVTLFFAVPVFATGTWTYTESTNTVQVTGGTSGTPAEFDDFVHADRTAATTACTIASGAELKAATAIAADTDLTLTYPVRPVEFKALRLAITTDANGGAAASGDEAIDIFGTTAVWCPMTGASASGQKVVPVADLTHLYQVGDTVILIDISAPSTYETDTIASISEGVSITMTNNNTNSYATGDIVGIYQTEQIDSSGGHNTFWTTLPYGQIAMLTFTGYDGTNTGKVDQPIWGVIWDYGNGQYLLDCRFNIGDGSTSTYFASSLEYVSIASTAPTLNLQVTAAATFKMGLKQGSDTSTSGSVLALNNAAPWSAVLELDGICLFYASIIRNDNDDNGIVNIDNASSEFADCRFEGFKKVVTTTASTYKRVQFTTCTRTWAVKAVITADDILIGDYYGCALLMEFAPENTEISNVTVQDDRSIGTNIKTAVTADVFFTNPNFTFNFDILTWTADIYEQYTCDIHVSDKDGNNLQGASVACETTGGSAAFTTQSTAADGTISQQKIKYKRWYNNSGSPASQTYSPHKFTISKSGYETLVLDNITVDGAIDWHLELQPAQGAWPSPWR